MHRLDATIGGIALAALGDEACIADLADYFSGFVQQVGKTDEISRAEQTTKRPDILVTVTRNDDLLTARPPHEALHCEPAPLEDPSDLDAVLFERAGIRGYLRVRADRSVECKVVGLSTFQRFPAAVALRIALSVWLPYHHGLLLHASAIALPESPVAQSVVFLGPSGRGKSTSARLCREAGALAVEDELLIVLPARQAEFAQNVRTSPYLAIGAPFGEDNPRGVRPELRIARAFMLEQCAGDEPHNAADLPLATAVARLSRCVIAKGQSLTSSEALIDAQVAFARATLLGTLRFRKSSDLLSYVRKSVALVPRK